MTPPRDHNSIVTYFKEIKIDEMPDKELWNGFNKSQLNIKWYRKTVK
jgi:hypothetical protein